MTTKFLTGLLRFCILLLPFLAKGQLNFTSSDLANCTVANPTSLQFGPDGRLYVAQQDGTIKVYTIARNGPNNYTVTATENILLVKQIPNHFDDGTLKPFNNFTNRRQVTGLYVTGTSTNPVIYVSSSDSDIGAGANGDKDLCTNSGIVSRLTWNGTKWEKMDLVRGLPRSEENHSPNGIQVDEAKQMLYLAVGGFTNAGSPSKLFAYISEYALSACILSIDLKAIDALPVRDATGLHPYKYDLPTLDDPTRSNNPDGSDINDPFGGNDGLNQAKLVDGGPVQVFVPGLRNPYDLVITKTPGKQGRLYFVDNGANPSWGGYPENEGPQGNVTNNYVEGEPGSVTGGGDNGVVDNLDGIHKIELTGYISRSYYAGHPCPTRANPTGAGLYTHSGTLETGVGVFRTSKTSPDYPLPQDWPPVPISKANPIEGDFQNPGSINNKSLLTFDVSTNGICEYTASNFGGALKGDLLVINFEGTMYRLRVGQDGSFLNSKNNKKMNQDPSFASGFGTKGLDITSQGDNDKFPGTIWVVNYGSNTITAFEPQDILCAGTYSSSLDEDKDGYSNSDEIDNATDPCSAASKPDDNDLDLISDLNDPDDDNDSINDRLDAFALDKFNGANTKIPVTYTLFNNDPGTGFFGLGFTGLMTNKTSDYRTLYNKDNLIAGGAIGAFTIDKVPAGDATGTANTQQYAFQFGVNVSKNLPPFLVHAILLGKFFNGLTPANDQSQGIYIGNGDQDNYLKAVLNANNGKGGIQVVLENNGVATSFQYALDKLPSSTLDLMISVDPLTGVAQVKISADGGPVTPLGSPITLSGLLLNAIQVKNSLAVGIIATSKNATPFNATWDLIEVIPDPSMVKGSWEYLTSSDSSIPEHRHEDGFVQCGDKFYLLGGRGIKPVSEYDPATKTWKAKAKSPIELNHFQAVSFDNLIYVVCAFNGGYPYEVPVPNIYIYDPATDKWIKGREIPAERRRGSAGVVVYNRKLYIAGGITNGHTSGFVPWLDEFDPATNQWKALSDAPRARDHFNAAVNGGKLYLAGGRQSSGATGQIFNLTIPEVDIYDFSKLTWSTNPNNIPTQRAGCTAVTMNEEVIVIGGESMAHMNAHSETEALNINTGTWRKLDTLNQGRHGTQAIVSNGGIYITGGSSSRGGSASTELSSVEEFHFASKNPPTGVAIVRSGLDAPAQKDLGSVVAGSQKTDTVRVKNVDGNQAIMIQQVKLKNNSDSSFSLLFNLSPPFFLAPDKSLALPVSFKAINTLSSSADIVLVHSGKGDSTIIHLIANGAVVQQVEWTPLFYVNAGGSAVSNGSQQWLDDSPATPSTYSNSTATFNKTTQLTYSGTNTTDAPTYIFNSYRWDGGVKGNAVANEMQWNFPVPEKGLYKIDLYFAESYAGTSLPGQRLFDIMIEDTIRSDNFDIVAEAGYRNAIKKTYILFIKDGFINIYFLHEVQNPMINGIVIYRKSGTMQAEVLPQDLNFGSQLLTTTSTNSIRLRNYGPASFPVNNITLSGNDNSAFKSGISYPFTLAPGKDTLFSVTFRPMSVGAKTATLSIYSSSIPQPLTVALSGEGIAGSNVVSLINPVDGTIFQAGDSITLKALVSIPEGSPYLKINCPDNGWRKLKLGYNSLNLYNPKYNVVSGGNNKLELVIKAVTNISWDKIQIRPQGIITSPVVLSNYISQAITLPDGYLKITIPLSDFSNTIDFTQLTLIEFPYSAGAGIFEMNLQSLSFTGGSSSFNWFGNGKTDNKQDGVGGGGQLFAELKGAASRKVKVVYFYKNQTLLSSDTLAPYQYTWKNAEMGSYDLKAKAQFEDGTEELSNTVSITVVQNKALVSNLKESTSEEPNVLYRVNAGGDKINSRNGIWEPDSTFTAINNTVIISRKGEITIDASVPEGTPKELFDAERSTDNDSITYQFPVAEGGEVEVRLYFTEADQNGPADREFGVATKDSLKLKEVRSSNENGKRKGFMRSFRTTSNGSVDINLVKVSHKPSISGIEIICLNNKCDPKKGRTAKTDQKQEKTVARAYPNPFSENLLINFTAPEEGKALVRIYNQSGEVIKELEVAVKNHTEIQIDLSTLPRGIYFMQIVSGGKSNQTIKLIKE